MTPKEKGFKEATLAQATAATAAAQVDAPVKDNFFSRIGNVFSKDNTSSLFGGEKKSSSFLSLFGNAWESLKSSLHDGETTEIIGSSEAAA
jgi:hypothetical protein